MDFVPVVIIVGVIAFVAWKEQDKIIAFIARTVRRFDRVDIAQQKPEPGAAVPDPGASAQKPIARPDPSYANPTHDSITDRLFRPSAEAGRALDGRIGGAVYEEVKHEPVPGQWVNRRVVSNVAAGVYRILSDSPKHGYMVTGRTGGYDARFNGLVGGTTLKPSSDLVMTLEVDKDCEAVFMPIVD